MAMDLKGDIRCTHCNAKEGVIKRTVRGVFRFPFAIAPIGK